MSTPKSASPRVLVVDDDPAISGMLVRALERNGFSADAAASADAALASAQDVDYAAAVIDLVMPGRNGVELAIALRERLPGLCVAVLTGYPNSPLIKEAEAAGARAFAKPVPIEELVGYLETELPARSR